jgi:RNA polymerase sigma factor (sigma-70 family)
MKVSSIGHLQTLFEAGTAAGLPDPLLLERFITGRDGGAFEAIVARHGPMVLGLCRRMLTNTSDTEDAFQATFLILVRRAGTLRDRQRLGPWLYGVAHRVAVRARAQAARRHSRERQVTVLPANDPGADLERLEILAVLDDEVSRLPEKYKAVLVLCDLEGRSQQDVARQLGCALGTVKSRLSAARERLRGRLIRRGLAPAAVTLAAAALSRSSDVAVPEELVNLTVKGAVQFIAAPAAVAQAVSAPVLVLTEGVLTTMFLSKLKTLGTILVAAGTCAAGLAVFAQAPSENREDKQIEALENQIRLLKERRDALKRLQEHQDTAAAGLQKLGAVIERGVVSINLAATNISDVDLGSLSVFTNLQTLHLHHTQIGDAGVANLKNLRNLTFLDLFDTRVTDAGLAHVAEWMPHLERLELYDTQITDAGLGSLKGLKHLRRLDVRKTSVTTAGVAAFRRERPGVEIMH